MSFSLPKIDFSVFETAAKAFRDFTGLYTSSVNTAADWKLILTHTGSFTAEIYLGEYDEMVSRAIDRKSELYTCGFAITSAKLIFQDGEDTPIDITGAI
ncbi:hypothetical protein V0288_11175 [Pannus brasiliensis CCIBt3594]|uniref:Uncharacterized protein n=1 Tax=Pannus brasiliensis CCIBt3594 TaxID=1427578 RepID=A0AAW9QS71_9CHRO